MVQAWLDLVGIARIILTNAFQACRKKKTLEVLWLRNLIYMCPAILPLRPLKKGSLESSRTMYCCSSFWTFCPWAFICTESLKTQTSPSGCLPITWKIIWVNILLLIYNLFIILSIIPWFQGWHRKHDTLFNFSSIIRQTADVFPAVVSPRVWCLFGGDTTAGNTSAFAG